jgi:MFS superfamily sulfate permease-like transporter
VTSARLAALAERKALLVTRAQLDRTRLALATHQIRAIVRPASDAVHGARLRPVATMLVGLAVPLLGMRRFARWVRFASFALTAYRVARNWRGAS